LNSHVADLSGEPNYFFVSLPSSTVFQVVAGGLPLTMCVQHSHRGCPILAFFARVGGDAAGAIARRIDQPHPHAFLTSALRKVREEWGAHRVNDVKLNTKLRGQICRTAVFVEQKIFYKHLLVGR
jgi:hypothetical protein